MLRLRGTPWRRRREWIWSGRKFGKHADQGGRAAVAISSPWGGRIGCKIWGACVECHATGKGIQVKMEFGLNALGRECVCLTNASGVKRDGGMPSTETGRW